MKKAVEKVKQPQIIKIGVRLPYNIFSIQRVNPNKIPKCPGSVIGPATLRNWNPPISKIMVSYERIKPENQRVLEGTPLISWFMRSEKIGMYFDP